MSVPHAQKAVMSSSRVLLSIGPGPGCPRRVYAHKSSILFWEAPLQACGSICVEVISVTSTLSSHFFLFHLLWISARLIYTNCSSFYLLSLACGHLCDLSPSLSPWLFQAASTLWFARWRSVAFVRFMPWQ